MKAICRIAKLHQKSQLGGMSAHNERTRETPNANPELKEANKTFIGSGDIVQDWEKRIEQLGIEKIRKNGVIAVDHLLSASPEFFKNRTPEDGMPFDKENLNKWVQSTNKFLRENYGDNVISATVHLDEKTPHIHAMIVPEVNGKLNAREIFGGKEKMRDLQDRYHQSVRHLGLERGVKGSTAKHEQVQKYYTRANDFQPLEPRLERPDYSGLFRGKEVNNLIDQELNNQLRPIQKTNDELRAKMNELKQQNKQLAERVKKYDYLFPDGHLREGVKLAQAAFEKKKMERIAQKNREREARLARSQGQKSNDVDQEKDVIGRNSTKKGKGFTPSM